MKVADILRSRQRQWQELEQVLGRLGGRSAKRVPAELALRFAALYRAVCADLALAEAYHLPRGTVAYLHQLVARAHNLLYRSTSGTLRQWMHEVFVNVPRRLRGDNLLKAAAALFWGVFLLALAAGYLSQSLAEQIVDPEWLHAVEDNFSSPPRDRDAAGGVMMAGFYTIHNPGIGLQCFASGLVFGVGGLPILLANAAQLGAIFGYMLRSPNAANFCEFVSAHGPLELTAIVLCAAAGMRLGFALVDTGGYTRGEAVRRAAEAAMPTLAISIALFLMAAGIEAFVSPADLPYAVKAGVMLITATMLLAYLLLLGRSRRT